MIPNDTITHSQEYCGPQSVIISSGDQHTILGVAMQQSNVSSDTTVECGNIAVAKNYATNYSHVPMNYQCEDNIELTKTGNDCAFVILNYTPYLTSDYSTTTQYGFNPPTNISSSSDVVLYGSFTSGELMIAFLLFLHLFLTLLYTMVKSLKGIKTKKKYIEYSNGDVPISEQL